MITRRFRDSEGRIILADFKKVDNQACAQIAEVQAIIHRLAYARAIGLLVQMWNLTDSWLFRKMTSRFSLHCL